MTQSQRDINDGIQRSFNSGILRDFDVGVEHSYNGGNRLASNTGDQPRDSNASGQRSSDDGNRQALNSRPQREFNESGQRSFDGGIRQSTDGFSNGVSGNLRDGCNLPGASNSGFNNQHQEFQGEFYDRQNNYNDFKIVSIVSELLNDFDGTSENFENWERQVYFLLKFISFQIM